MSVSYGGQAVLEGVMMRGPAVWSVAVRTPNGDVVEVTKSVVSPMQRHRIWRLPVIRGVIALGESLAIGFKALRYDVEVREQFLARVAELRPDLRPEDILATPTVVLAIRLKYGVPITAESLFAFSQVSLLQTDVALQGMGAKVEVVPIYA